MRKVIHCECGEVVRGANDEELIGAVKVHVERDHPDLLGKLGNEDILAMAEEDE